MKRPALTLMIAFLTLMPLHTQARQNTAPAEYHGSDARKMSKKLTSISGKVASDGKIFTADKDNKIWKVSNPEALTGIEERHIKVKAHVDVAQSLIRIVSVSAISEERGGVKLGDAAFRR